MKPVRIVIDPGHGGTDRSNKGPTKYIEADGVLVISKYLRNFLEQYEGVDVVLTRTTDVFLKKSERGKIGAKADLFISQHTNAGGGNARGTEVFYGVKQPQSKELAASLSKAVASLFSVPNRGAKIRANSLGNDYYAVISAAYTYGAKHCLIIESLFHDNKLDEAILLQDANLMLIAKAQALVIAEHFKLRLKEVKPMLPQPSAWAKEAWQKAIEVKIVDGTNPQGNVTREQLVTILDRLGLIPERK